MVWRKKECGDAQLYFTSYGTIAYIFEINFTVTNRIPLSWSLGYEAASSGQFFSWGILTWPIQDDWINMTEPWQGWNLTIEHDQNWNQRTFILCPGSSLTSCLMVFSCRGAKRGAGRAGQIIISENNKTYHTSPSCYHVLDLLCVNKLINVYNTTSSFHQSPAYYL